MYAPNAQSFDLTRWLVSVSVPAFAGLAGVLIGAWLTGRQQNEQRKLDFVEKQLRLFYSPLLGIRNEIRMLSELRVKISHSADRHWRKLCEEAQLVGGAEYLQKVTAERRDEFMKLIDYDNKQLTENLLPAYRRMVSIFRDNYYLSIKTTADHFLPLLEFVDIWDRWLDRSIPREVIEELGHDEKKLEDLYSDLEETHTALRTKLSNGKS
jgi:hypothetical protein